MARRSPNLENLGILWRRLGKATNREVDRTTPDTWPSPAKPSAWLVLSVVKARSGIDTSKSRGSRPTPGASGIRCPSARLRASSREPPFMHKGMAKKLQDSCTIDPLVCGARGPISVLYATSSELRHPTPNNESIQFTHTPRVLNCAMRA
jgi:hypothetical protein